MTLTTTGSDAARSGTAAGGRPVAFVTGATKGIGLAVAHELAADGYRLLLNYRSDAEQAKKALAEVRALQPDTELVQADIAESAEVDRMFRLVRSELGRLDAFVCNAGVSADGYAIMMGEQKWRKVVDTNLTGSFLCCRAAGRLMANQRSGAIVAVSSTSGFNAPPGQANYAASKAGLVALVKVMAKELGSYNVRVNAVVPGFVETAMTRAMPRKQLEEHIAHVPLGRIGQPADIGPAVRFLLDGEAARYVTGTTLVVDGGLTC